MYKSVEFSREEMHRKVWTTPLLKLAKEIGVSDVALGKACRRAGIPLPGRGHWAIPERKRPGPPKLPPLKEPHYETIRFDVLDAVDAANYYRPQAAPGESVPVPTELTAPHRLVEKTLKVARAADSHDGRLTLGAGVLHVRVSSATLDRSMLLMDTLIKASEARGHRWQTHQDGTTVVMVTGEAIKVWLKERLTKKDIPPPSRSKRPGEPDFFFGPTFTWESTGQLSFEIDEYLSGPARKRWNDTPNTKLESKLHEILAGLPLAAAAMKAHRAEIAERKRKEAQEQEKFEEWAAKVEIQRRLRNRLVQTVERWERAQRLRAFADVVGARLISMSDLDRARAEAWLEWAIPQIEHLDPLQGDTTKIFDLSVNLGYWSPGSRYNPPKVNDGWWEDCPR